LLGYYPSGHPVLRTLIDVTDRQIVYGGPELRDSLIDRPAADVHGPVRALCIVADGAADETILARLLELLAGDAGRFCTAARTVLCHGDPAELGARLAAALDGIALRPGQGGLPLTASPDATAARRIAESIDTRLTDGARRLTSRPTLVVCDGLAFLAPTLLELPGPDPADCTPSWAAQHPLFGFEAPFPIASIVRATAAQAAALARQADIVHRLSP
jgi:acyl-CoA reductase-like NAD-dependent aldehyde dehydrogenase